MKTYFRRFLSMVPLLAMAMTMAVCVSPVAFADDPYYLDGSVTADPQWLTAVDIVATDEPAVEVVGGGILYMESATVTHQLTATAVTGAVLASGASAVYLEDVQIATDGVSGLGANAVHATDPGTVVTLKDVDIDCGEYAARGVYTTGGGTIIAENVTVETWKGGGGAAIATSGENGGNIQVRGGVFTTNAGMGSAAVFSTGYITVSDATLTALVAEGAVLDGPASIALENTFLSAAANVGVAIVKSPLPDTGTIPDGTSVFTMRGGELAASGALFYCPNANAVIDLQGVRATTDSGVLLTTAYSGGGPGGDPERGAVVDLTASRQNLEGDIVCDDDSRVSISLKGKSVLTGAVNSDAAAGVVALALDESSTWRVTADSYVTVLSLAGEAPHRNRHGEKAGERMMRLPGIHCDQGVTVYYDADANPWLGGETYPLPGGGELAPWIVEGNA